MNKARPLLLERPGFFAAGQERGESCRGAGERAAAGRGEARSVLRGVMRRKADGDVQGNAGRTENTEEHTGHPQQSGQRASQSAQGIPERAGHPRAHRAPQSAQGHPRAHRAPQSAQDTPERAGHRRARRDTSGRTGATRGACRGYRRVHGTPQAARGHPRAQGGASKQSVCGRKKGPPAAARRGQKNLFLLCEKNFKFLGKNS